MKQKEKELLIKDICARLSYGVKALYYDYVKEKKVSGIIDVICIDQDDDDKDCDVGIGYKRLELSEIKLCLYPLSSMTEEQKEEFRNKFDINIDISKIFNGIDFYGSVSFRIISEIIDWCYKNHLDINDLIPNGLAIDCTNLNIY